ncbi:MAG: T9SS type A sorting domain-containing protein [Bacteroidetes bacterium]|nr:T9SS type A sorting domain-containing protein [Bacteroidota bacterium]
MKNFTLYLILAIVSTSFSQNASEKKLLKKAKELGITKEDLPGFLRIEANKTKHNITPKQSYSLAFKKGSINSVQSTSSTCGNLDFEDGNFNGWSAFDGTNVNSLALPTGVTPASNISTSGINAGAANPCIVDSANSFDPTLSMSIVSPYSKKTIARVNHIGNGARAGILERQIAITAANNMLNFSYFTILEQPNHPLSGQPCLNINCYDASNNAIPGTSLNITVLTGTINPGFIPLGSFYYKPWTPVTIDLTAYIGQTITIQFIAEDCVYGGHSGYSYIDLDCNGGSTSTPNVWPGDCNYDLSVNYLDLFYIGAGYGQTGVSRSILGIPWSPLASAEWSTRSLYLVNSKHADCDGDGTVAFNDLSAILFNYGQNHPFKLQNATHLVAGTTNDIPLAINATADTVVANQNFVLSFNLGNGISSVDSIYGLGFKMNYPSAMLNSSITSIDASTSVIDNTSGLLQIKHISTSNIDMAICKSNHANTTNVLGNAFSLNLKAAPTITATTAFTFNIPEIKAITKSGSLISLSPISKTVVFKASGISGINENSEIVNVNCFPNPAKDKFSITFNSGILRNYDVVITNLLGATVLTFNNVQQENNSFDIRLLNTGVYFVNVLVDKKTIALKKLIVE